MYGPSDHSFNMTSCKLHTELSCPNICPNNPTKLPIALSSDGSIELLQKQKVLKYLDALSKKLGRIRNLLLVKK